MALAEFDKAIPLLDSFHGSQRNANVENLLAQSYLGTGQSGKAFTSVQRAAKANPRDEKLYLYIADACNAYADYDLGLKTVELGLEKLPRAARLHYQRGVFLSLLEAPEEANRAFDKAIKLAGDDSIGYVAAAHKNLFAGNVAEALRAAREGVRKGKPDLLLLSFLGEALIRTGVAPGDPGFAEARVALEQALAERPSSPRAHSAGQTRSAGPPLERRHCPIGKGTPTGAAQSHRLLQPRPGLSPQRRPAARPADPRHSGPD